MFNSKIVVDLQYDLLELLIAI